MDIHVLLYLLLFVVSMRKHKAVVVAAYMYANDFGLLVSMHEMELATKY